MSEQTGIVLVHGAWHSGSTWSEVAPLLRDKGFDVVAVDLPGAGPNASRPASFSKRPLESAVFATEPSPNAGVGQEERTQAFIDAVRASSERTGKKVVLAGHSLGGITVSPVVEAVPELIHAVVYVTAFMLAPGLPAIAMIQDATMADAIVPQLFLADPQTVGALRIDVASTDPEYRQKLKEAFYGDLTESQFEAALAGLHPDEPVQVAIVPSPVTPERFATVPRHYVRCTQDRAITLAGQDKMIADMDAALGGKTIVHTLNASHSPFYSAPDALSDILSRIAGT
ncbi:alpha/beta fold hydrolase [Roseibium salinum]|uniref:Alpha/beta fold hydrolase n=1 Tax=Roseibium salinum TaxID=1604349 RepID=A0ABT3QWS9_9HYPH|nr:alpha/beta fold hydrolase [Roseibium sp. DSM 29163]MCX2721393.1 alpha/beta fold hydrolase [Roseibium sp. DSM 29163]